MSRWPIIELSRVAKVSSGDGAPQEASAFGETGTPFIRAGSLVPLLNGTHENQLELIPEAESRQRRMHRYPAHTIVFAKSGMSCMKGLVYELKGAAHVVNHLAALECNSQLYSRFLLRWFQMNPPTRLIANSSYPSIKISDIRSEQIPLPPLAEQKRIATILDTADAMRVKRREAIALLDELLQSTFLDMFGDPVTNPMGWEQVNLSSLIEAGDKINYGVVQPGDDHCNGKPLIRVGDMAGGVLSLTNVKFIDPKIETKYLRSRLNGRELLVSCVGSIGTVCKVPEEAVGFNIARAVARIPIKESMSRDFMLHYLRSEVAQRHFLKETRTVSQPTLNINLIKTTPVIQPPLDLQRRFAAIAESVERQKTKQRAHLAELETLFASLQQRAFNGEL